MRRLAACTFGGFWGVLGKTALRAACCHHDWGWEKIRTHNTPPPPPKDGSKMAQHRERPVGRSAGKCVRLLFLSLLPGGFFLSVPILILLPPSLSSQHTLYNLRFPWPKPRPFSLFSFEYPLEQFSPRFLLCLATFASPNAYALQTHLRRIREASPSTSF